MKDGLPGPNVYSALQDSKGYIWLATDRGVSRFNGYEFETFDTDDGLPDNTVFEIFEDHHGRIWFAPFNLELVYFQDGKIHPYQYNDRISQYAKAYDVTSFLHITKGDTLHLGVYLRGVISISPDGNASLLNNEHPDYSSVSLAVSVEGKTYPSSMAVSGDVNRGFELISLGEKKSREFYPTKNNFSGRPFVASIGNKTLIGGRMHLLTFENKAFRTHNFDNWVINLYTDKTGDLWVSHRSSGLLRYTKGDLSTTPTTYFPNTTVTHLLEDREGGLWFCTEGSGLFYTPTLAIQEYIKEEQTSSKNVIAITDGGKNGLFVGYNDGHMDRIANGNIEAYLKGPDNPRQPRYVRDIIYYEEQNELLFVSSGILTEIDLNQSSPTLSYPFGKQRDGMRMAFKSSNGMLWAGSKHEIIGYQTHKDVEGLTLSFEKIEHASKSSNRLGAIGEDFNGALLVGTYAGLYRRQDTVLVHLGKVHPFFNSRITDILETSEGVYISSRTDGVAFWNSKGIALFNKAWGLSSNHVNALAQDANGHVWLASNNGLDELFKNGDGAIQVRHYGPQHGLPAKEINCLMIQDSIIWLGTTDGLMQFDLSNYEINTQAPPIHIASISINQKDTQLQEHFELDYRKNYLHIDFLGIAFRHGNKMQYKYRMQGVDEEWLNTQERSVQYPTLPDGNYTFEVIAENEWGVPSEKAAQFSFYIAPPWWETFAVRFLFIAGLVLFITLFFVMRVSAIKKREAERSALSNEISEMKLKLLRAQMNPHFTFNTINSILDYISKNDRHNARNYLSKFALLLRYILEGSDKALNTIAEEVKALELYLQLEQFRFGEKLQYKISISRNVLPEFDRIPTMLIQPLIENAILHGIMPKKEPGTVHLSIDKNEHFISVEVEDDGVGRSAGNEKRANGHKSMSTGIVQDRLRLLNKAKNTTVHFKITDLTNDQGNALGTHVQLQIAAN